MSLNDAEFVHQKGCPALESGAPSGSCLCIGGRPLHQRVEYRSSPLMPVIPVDRKRQADRGGA